MMRGDHILHKGKPGMVVFAFPSGTEDHPTPWAKVVLQGTIFQCVDMAELTPDLERRYGAVCNNA